MGKRVLGKVGASNPCAFEVVKEAGSTPTDAASILSTHDRNSGLRATCIFATLRITPIEKKSEMIRCHLSTLMGRDKLRISDVAKSTGLNRSTITALYNETATRVDLPAIESLCHLFQCQVGELFEVVPPKSKAQP